MGCHINNLKYGKLSEQNRGSPQISGDNYLCKKIIIEKSFIEAAFPTELLNYFEITSYQVLCSVKEKPEYWLIDFQERNELPKGLSFNEYETKDFTYPKLYQLEIHIYLY